HRLGDDQAKDTLIYERPDHPRWWIGGDVTDDGRYLMIYISEGGEKNQLHYIDLKEAGGKPRVIVDYFEGSFQVLGNVGPVLYVFSNYKAQRGRVISIDLRNPAQAAWRIIVPEEPNMLETVNMVSNSLVCSYLKDVRSTIMVFGLDGKLRTQLDLPGV